jgi:hypothetical protein
MIARTRRALYRAWSLRTAAVVVCVLPLAIADAHGQWSTVYEQFYLQASHNWQFRERYTAADRLFNAFDYGHAILYETLWREPRAPASVLEEKEYDFLTKRVLVRPPRVPLEEGAIEIRYAQLAPEAKVMFEWAHILHRQIYDVLADERLSSPRKDAEIARLIAYYKSRPDVAFSSRPKSMRLMQEQPYSLAFRQRFPKFNGLIWAYHWLQVGLYEPLLMNSTSAARQAGVRATVARFWQMLEDPPRSFPYQMPMTAAVAPRFAERYPEAAIIFDNLHSMHDVISDILANPRVPREGKRAEILRAARLYRDDSSFVMPVAAWRAMARHMGAENMGGPAVNFLPELPTPTVTYGAVMTHDEQTGEMTGFAYGSATGGEHAEHSAPPADSASGESREHIGMAHGARDSAHAMQSERAPEMTEMMRLHELMMRDSVIRRRVLSDTAMRRLMTRVVGDSAIAELVRTEEKGRTPAVRARPPEREAPGRRTRKAEPPRPRPAERDSTAGHHGHTPPGRQ